MGRHRVAEAVNDLQRHRYLRYERWRSWRWPLLGALVAVQLAGVLLSPVMSESEDFFADLAAGRVQSLKTGTFEQYPEAGYRFTPWAETSGTTDTSGTGQVRWVGRFGAVYQADLRFGPSGSWEGAIDLDHLDVTATAAATARQANVAVPDRAVRLDAPGAPFLPWAVAVVMLLIVWFLVVGPEPRRFTRWGWVWIIALLPAGLGAVWYLLREAPWHEPTSQTSPLPPRMTRGVHDPAGPPRRGGWLALFLGLAAGQVLAALLLGGLSTLTNHHADLPKTWTLVDTQERSVVVHR